MLSALLAAAVASATPQALPPKLVLSVCTASYLDKRRAAAAGEPPISFAVPDAEAKLNLNAAQQASLEQSCEMFENGALFVTILSTGNARAASMDDDDGEIAPDHRDENVTLHR